MTRPVEPSATPLASFDSFMIDARHRELSSRLFSWSIERSPGADPGQHAKRAFIASAFGRSCAPRSASVEETLTSCKFLMLFFLIDDAPSSIMDEFAYILEGGGCRFEATDAQAELLGYHRDLSSDLRERGCDTTGFELALQNIVSAMREEKAADTYQWSFEHLLAVRRVVVGIPAFSECWRTIRGLSFTPGVRDSLERSRVFDLTCETACIINDIASFDRDEQMMRDDPRSADPNLVLLRMRELGDRRSAIDDAVDWYNRRMGEFLDEERKLLVGEHGSDPSLTGYLEILRGAIIGDLATTKHLAPMRYEGSRETLDRLVRLDLMSQ